MKRALAAAGLLLSLAIGGAAFAGDPKSAAVAQTLFDAALGLMEGGRYAEACPKLEEALALEPSAVGAKLRLGECYEGQRRLASAWAMYVVAEGAARAAGQHDREEKARARATALEPRLSRLTVVVLDPTRRLPGLAIARDEAPVGPGQWSVPIPVDGGNHVVTATAAGKARWENAVLVPEEGGSVVVNVGPLADATPSPLAAPTPAPSPVISPPAPGPSVPAIPASPDHPRAVPLWAWIAGAGGLALGAVGAGFGTDNLLVAGRQQTLCGPARNHCELAEPLYDPAPDNARRMRDYGLFVGFAGAGLALTGTAVVGAILDTRPSRQTTFTPWVTPRAAGAAYTSSF